MCDNGFPDDVLGRRSVHIRVQRDKMTCGCFIVHHFIRNNLLVQISISVFTLNSYFTFEVAEYRCGQGVHEPLSAAGHNGKARRYSARRFPLEDKFSCFVSCWIWIVCWTLRLSQGDVVTFSFCEDFTFIRWRLVMFDVRSIVLQMHFFMFLMFFQPDAFGAN